MNDAIVKLIETISAWPWPAIAAYAAAAVAWLFCGCLALLRALWRRLGRQKLGTPTTAKERAVDHPKPTPYAPQGHGSKPECPWVTREEFERHVNELNDWRRRRRF